MRLQIAHTRRLFLRLLSIVTGAVLLLGGYFWHTTTLPTMERLRLRAAHGNTRILDRNGQVLYEIPDPLDGHQRPFPLAEIPRALQQATVAVEDARFFSHRGVDLRGIIRAAWENVQQGQIVAGGSTITQQLARTFLLDPQLAQQDTLERKLHEMVLAIKLSTHLSKAEVLALYLNQTYYGGMAYGVEAAAQYYFSKPVRDLDLAECAMLAGLPQAPSSYNPLHYPEIAKQRQQQVLAAMVRQGYLTQAQATTASEEPLQFASGHQAIYAPHFVFFVLDQLVERYGAETVARGGLVVTTTLDLDLQQATQTALRQHLAQLAPTPSSPDGEPTDHRVRNGAVVVLDIADGAVLAMVGSPDYFNAAIQGQVNGALSLRQPGSAIKPLTYAAALEQGWTPATIIMDAPASFPTRNGTPYTPENYDHRYQGAIPLREALATSSNVAAVQTLAAIGLPSLLALAQRFGITTLTKSDYGLSLTLGGGEVRLLELSAAYATFARGGAYLHPTIITVVADGQGERPFAQQSLSLSSLPLPATSPQVAYLINDILSDRYARMRTFGGAASLTLPDRPSAVKTGTTTNWRDAWTIGYTPDRVVGVWVGNADGEPMVDMTGARGAAPIWHTVMLAAHRDVSPRPFDQPSGIVEAAVCMEKGQHGCILSRLERFIAGTEPTTVVSPPSAYHSPPNAQDTRPVYGVGAEVIGQSGEPRVIFPAMGARFFLSGDIPRTRQQIRLQARVGDTNGSITFVLDGQALATLSTPPYETLWQLERGEHRLVVVVENVTTGSRRHSEEVVFVVE